MGSPLVWKRSKLEEVSATFSGGTPTRENAAFFGGGIPWVKSGEVNFRTVRSTEETISNLALQNSSARIAPNGSVLVAMYGATAGKVALLQIDAAINQAILAVVANHEVADGRFLFHALEHETPQILRKVQGSGQPNLSGSILRSHELLLPPLPEQRKIAAVLSSVDDAIEATQAVIEQLQVVKKAMMAKLFTRGLPGRHTKFKMTEIGEVPEDWEVCSLGDVLSTIDSGWSPLCENRSANHDEWGVLKVSAVSWGEFRPDENKKLPGNLVPRPQLVVAPGDLLVSRANTPELVGRCVLVRVTRPRLMLSDKLLRLRAVEGLATPGFIRLALETPSGRQQIQDGATGSSRSMKNISQEKLRSVRLPRPSLVEQGSITRAFDHLAERMTVEKTCLDGLRTMKVALMSVLLTGEIRVKPDEEAT